MLAFTGWGKLLARVSLVWHGSEKIPSLVKVMEQGVYYALPWAVKTRWAFVVPLGVRGVAPQPLLLSLLFFPPPGEPVGESGVWGSEGGEEGDEFWSSQSKYKGNISMLYYGVWY